MSADFNDAAYRHWEDATLLRSEQRLANADQLFGLSAECALKAVMQGLGMLLRADGSPADRQHRVHVNDLWAEFLTFANNRGGARYAALLGTAQNPFNQWDVSHRYKPRSSFTHATVANHEAGAGLTKLCLDTAVMDGVVV